MTKRIIIKDLINRLNVSLDETTWDQLEIITKSLICYFNLIIDDSKHAMEWISVEDKLPPQDCYVLVTTKQQTKTGPFYCSQIAARFGHSWVDDKDGKIIEPKYGVITYWMPIPDLPEDCNGMD